MYGGALPPPPSDLFRGPLIRNKSIIKQVKNGQKRLQAEREQLEAKHRTESALYRTFVGGLLEFEMPEVPNLNSNLQKFLVWQDPRLFRHTYDRNNNNNHTRNSHNTNTTSPDPQLHREKSRSATFTQPQAGSQMTPRSVKSEQASPHSPDPSVIPRSGSTTDLYIPSPLHSPRVAFVTTQFLQNKLLAAAPEAGHSKSKANHAPASKRRGHACPNDDPRGELQPRRVGVVEKMGVGKGVEFDEDELYHAMTEYGLYQELGKSNGLYINKADEKNKSSKSLVLPELAPI